MALELRKSPGHTLTLSLKESGTVVSFANPETSSSAGTDTAAKVSFTDVSFCRPVIVCKLG